MVDFGSCVSHRVSISFTAHATLQDAVEIVDGKDDGKKKKEAKKPLKGKEPSVLATMFRCFYGTLMPAACMKLTYDALQFVGPILLKCVKQAPFCAVLI